ncbi:MAG: RNA methyltransferase [Firmicutes bacterium]|nr:RNA methyltransferase [Bacillota bacterium]
MREITSKDNKIFRHALSLKTKKYRDRNGEYLIEGPNLLKEALKEEIDVEAVFVRPEMTDEEAGIIEEGPELDRKTFILSNRLFDELKDTETSQGIVTVVRKRQDPSPKGRPGGNYVVLDRLQDPGNIGTILRTADAAGFDLAVFMKGTADPFSPKVVRSATGSLFRLPMVFVKDAEELAELVHSAGRRLIATAMDAEKAYYDCDLEKDAAIIIGNEGNGISPELMMRADEKIMIPMAGNTESLNVAVAAGILMYERIRRR